LTWYFYFFWLYLMKAIVCRNNHLQFEAVETRSLRPGEVRMSVRAIGVNRADLLQRKGLYPAPKDVRNDILGLECSGVVVEVSSTLIETHPNLIGKRVMALTAGEAYASEVIVDVGSVMRIPESLSFIQAAAIPEAFITAYDALWKQATIKNDDHVCIHAIGSGVGDAARQLCIANDISVFGTTRSAIKATQLSSSDCRVFQIIEGRFPEELPRPSLILDFVGASYFKQNIRLLKPWGHLQLVGLLGGIKTDVNLAQLLAKKLTVRGATLRDRSLQEKRRLIADFSKEVLPFFENGQLKPTVDTTYSWGDAEEAHKRMQSNQSIGKLILKVD